MEQAYINIKSK